jgi:hypothetical protein
MDIKDERQETDAIFADLNLGDVFEFGPGSKVLMKIDEVEYDYNVYNAVYLEDGDLERFGPQDKVIPLVVQLHIIRNE